MTFHCTDFHKTRNCWTVLRGDFLHRISHISVKKYGN